jgi:hypothetical protein
MALRPRLDEPSSSSASTDVLPIDVFNIVKFGLMEQLHDLPLFVLLQRNSKGETILHT